MDQEKLNKLRQQVRIGGKGTPRRKVVKKSTTTIQGDDRKLQTALKKLNVQPVAGVEEVNMFKDDGNVLHFSAPKVHSAPGSNTLAIYGNGANKDLTELVPGILNQLGPDSLASLRKLAESYSSLSARQAAAGGEAGEKEADEDDEIPQLVENFDEVEEGKEGAKEEGKDSKLEELN